MRESWLMTQKIKNLFQNWKWEIMSIWWQECMSCIYQSIYLSFFLFFFFLTFFFFFSIFSPFFSVFPFFFFFFFFQGGSSRCGAPPRRGALGPGTNRPLGWSGPPFKFIGFRAQPCMLHANWTESISKMYPVVSPRAAESVNFRPTPTPESKSEI